MENLIGAEAAAPPPADLIKDATEATFVADVIEASKDVPVIVDFPENIAQKPLPTPKMGATLLRAAGGGKPAPGPESDACRR